MIFASPFPLAARIPLGIAGLVLIIDAPKAELTQPPAEEAEPAPAPAPRPDQQVLPVAGTTTTATALIPAPQSARLSPAPIGGAPFSPDAAVIFSAAREKAWGPTRIRHAAAAPVVGLILVATGLSVALRLVTDGGWAPQIPSDRCASASICTDRRRPSSSPGESSTSRTRRAPPADTAVGRASATPVMP